MTIAQFESRVAADHPALAGHFPGDPVVPGALMLAIVHAQATERLGFRPGPSRWHRVRFVHPLRPEQRFRIFFEGDSGAFSFRIETRPDRPGPDSATDNLPVPVRSIARGSCRHGAVE